MVVDFTNAILSDDEEKLIDLITKTGTPNMRIEFKEPVFDILRFEPPIICVTAFFRSVKCVCTLLSYDIYLKLTDSRHRWLGYFIAAGGCLDILKDVVSAAEDGTITLEDIPVNIAAEFGSLDIIRYLYLEGVDINDPSPTILR